MFTPQLWIRNDSGGWRDLTPHADVCALSGISITWGTTDATKQPDPSVMSFTLIDHTGDTVRDAANLAGRRVKLTYDNAAAFWGIITSGLRVRRDHDGAWRITLTASSTMILWKRLRDKGPVSTSTTYAKELRDNYHWLDTSANILSAMNQRAKAVDGPTVIAPHGAFDFNKQGAAPYENSELPSQLTVLHAFGEDGHLPIWYEDAKYVSSSATLRAIELTASNKRIAIDTECRKIVWDGVTRSSQELALKASTVQSDGAVYELHEPYTKITFQLLDTTINDGKPSFSDAETSIGVQDVPDALKTVQKSIIVKTRHFKTPVYTHWAPFTLDTASTAACRLLLRNLCLRFTPTRVIFDTEDIDVAGSNKRRVFVPQPIPYLAFDRQPEHMPFDATGPYAAIGGTLTISWKDNRPRARNEVTLWPLPCDSTNREAWTWQQVPAGWTATYEHASHITYTDLTRTDEFLTYKAAA